MEDRINLFLIISFLQLWWIAVWGIVYIFIEYMSKKSKSVELLIYVSMMLVIIIIISRNPGLVPKF
jgi:predicted membrane channel-forming protein YqfA (hemolysin III family)